MQLTALTAARALSRRAQALTKQDFLLQAACS
jgi:hypothetical protein